jgi:hypothetical protein
MITGKGAGIDVITITRKGLWGRFIPPLFLDRDYCYFVFPVLVNRNTKASCSVQSVHSKWPIVDPSHSSFLLRNKCFFRHIRHIYQL